MSTMEMYRIQKRDLKLLLVAKWLIFTLMAANGQEWQILTVDEGVKPSIAVDEKGVPHIAYMLEAIPGYLRHAMLPADINDFVITEIDNAYYYGPLDIAIGPDGRPAVALHNHDDEDQNVYWQNEAGNWIKHRVRDGGHDGWDNSVVFDSDGFPHTSSVDPSQFGETSSVEYAWYDGNGWRVEKVGSGPVRYQFSTSIALQSDGTPAISYFDDISNQLKYALRAGGNWQILSVPGSGGMFSSLLFDQGDVPHLSYYALANGNNGAIRHAYLDGTSWVIEDIDQLFNVPITFAGARNVTSLQQDTEGRLHVAFNDRDELKYAVKTANTWMVETILDRSNSSATFGAQASLALDMHSNPHITYFEVTDLNPLRGIIKYLTRKSVTTSIDNKAEENIEVYPVPCLANGQLNILSSIRFNKVELIDITGKTHPLRHTSGAISLGNLNLVPGFYLLRLKMEPSNSYIIRHIILE